MPGSELLEEVDDLYAGFVSTLPSSLRDAAERLACTLELAPTRDVPWSEVFGHEVTLAAPALFAEAMPEVSRGARRDAMLAQALAAIEAFGTDRIEDRQVEATDELRAVLAQVRSARDRSLAHVLPSGVRDPDVDFTRMHATTLASIALERDVVRAGRPVAFETYESVSLGKQSVGFPPSLALAYAAGWGPRRRRAVKSALRSIWLALQMPDDVADWEDDYSRGGAWAVVLAGGLDGMDRVDTISLRGRVFASGILPRMLERGRWHFSAVRRLASVLGAPRLSAWAGEQESKIAFAVEAEMASAGRTARAHALIAWAAEVLR
jgi:hypothetical protein